jgi:predicted acyl esterase
VRVSENVGAPMRDGTVLRGDVYRPRGSGPWPVLAYLTLPVCTGG